MIVSTLICLPARNITFFPSSRLLLVEYQNSHPLSDVYQITLNPLASRAFLPSYFSVRMEQFVWMADAQI